MLLVLGAHGGRAAITAVLVDHRKEQDGKLHQQPAADLARTILLRVVRATEINVSMEEPLIVTGVPVGLATGERAAKEVSAVSLSVKYLFTWEKNW